MRSGTPGSARPSGPGRNTSLETTIVPSASTTSLTEDTTRRPRGSWERNTTKSTALATSRLVASKPNFPPARSRQLI